VARQCRINRRGCHWFGKIIPLLCAFAIATLCSGFSNEPTRFRLNLRNLHRCLLATTPLRRLREFADTEETLRIKLQQLDYINRQRHKFHLPPLQYDLLAGRVEMSHLTEETRERTFAHINSAGEYAYHRWAKTGRTDHVRENLFAQFSTGRFQRELSDQLKTHARGIGCIPCRETTERRSSSGGTRCQCHPCRFGVSSGIRRSQFSFTANYTSTIM